MVRVRARNGGRASVYEANGWAQAYTSGLLEGNGVTQNTVADMNVLVGGSATKPDVILAENAAGYRIALDIVSQQAITITTPASNSRISAIVAYTDDLALASSEDTITGSPASCGLIVVNGTASASPTAPTDNQIRTAITADGATGSQAAYCVIATVLVPYDATAIDDSMITMNVAKIGSQNIDFPTLKKWVPDYVNMDATNLLTGSGKTYTITITTTGFITYAIKRYGAGNKARLYINDRIVVEEEALNNNAYGPNGVVPVAAGDEVYCIYSADTSGNGVWFIPGKWVN